MQVVFLLHLSSPSGQVFNVMLYGEQCIPVTLCNARHPSKIILSNSHGPLHTTWTELSMRPDVNRIYNGTFSLCFRNVTESFLFLEYCEESPSMTCASDFIFCCNTWAEFVSRTCVTVDGSKLSCNCELKIHRCSLNICSFTS